VLAVAVEKVVTGWTGRAVTIYILLQENKAASSTVAIGLFANRLSRTNPFTDSNVTSTREQGGG
jgi:hypothetical protein